MPLETLLLRKWTAKSTFFFQKSYQIGPYCTYTVPHLPILFPIWPESQKDLPTPGHLCAYEGHNPWHTVYKLKLTPLTRARRGSFDFRLPDFVPICSSRSPCRGQHAASGRPRRSERSATLSPSRRRLASGGSRGDQRLPVFPFESITNLQPLPNLIMKFNKKAL